MSFARATHVAIHMRSHACGSGSQRLTQKEKEKEKTEHCKRKRNVKDRWRAEEAGQDRRGFKRVSKRRVELAISTTNKPSCFGEWAKISEWRSNPNFPNLRCSSPHALILTRSAFHLRPSDSNSPSIEVSLSLCMKLSLCCVLWI